MVSRFKIDEASLQAVEYNKEVPGSNSYAGLAACSQAHSILATIVGDVGQYLSGCFKNSSMR